MGATMCSLGLILGLYGTTTLTSGFHNIGLALWHSIVAVLIGSIEVMLLSIRVEHVTARMVRRVVVRAGFVAALLLATWPAGFAEAGPIRDFSGTGSWNPWLIVHLAAFHAFSVWGLAQIVAFNARRLFRDRKRRPVSAFAHLMLGLGNAGLVVVNVLLCAYIVTHDVAGLRALLVPTGILFMLCVGGAMSLAVGESIYDEVSARRGLRRLDDLWSRLVELSVHDLHLPSRLPAPVRLQRVYVEISDALCTLRVATDRELSIPDVIDVLARGEVTSDPAAPTISQALPARSTRREDLMVIHSLAEEYRRSRRARRSPVVAA